MVKGEGLNVFKDVDARLFKQLISKGDVVLIDVRTPGEYAQGHLKNSKLINFMDKNFETQIAQLDKGATTLVYCHSGRRSAGAMKKMKSAGFTEVYNLVGGIGAWAAAGGEMVK
ncbi:MAG: rhodanese-like domain-containing protein [Lewinellaceae bacterium]|nr:rhodanese-like domain-containing protein [Lewinellaceae bacterium]